MGWGTGVDYLPSFFELYTTPSLWGPWRNVEYYRAVMSHTGAQGPLPRAAKGNYAGQDCSCWAWEPFHSGSITKLMGG